MAKRVILAVAGAGKTYRICHEMQPEQKNLIVAFTHANIKTQIPRSVISRLTPAPSFPWTGRCIFDLQKPL